MGRQGESSFSGGRVPGVMGIYARGDKICYNPPVIGRGDPEASRTQVAGSGRLPALGCFLFGFQLYE